LAGERIEIFSSLKELFNSANYLAYGIDMVVWH